MTRWRLFEGWPTAWLRDEHRVNAGLGLRAERGAVLVESAGFLIEPRDVQVLGRQGGAVRRRSTTEFVAAAMGKREGGPAAAHMVRNDRRARSNRHREDLMDRFSAVHSQPGASQDHRRPGSPACGKPWADPIGVPPLEGIRLVGVTLSNLAGLQRSTPALLFSYGREPGVEA